MYGLQKKLRCPQSNKYETRARVLCCLLLLVAWERGARARAPRPHNVQDVVLLAVVRGLGTHAYLEQKHESRQRQLTMYDLNKKTISAKQQI